MVMLVMFSAEVVLVSVRVEVLEALVVPTSTEPKLMVAGRRVAVGAVTPVPVRVTI